MQSTPTCRRPSLASTTPPRNTTRGHVPATHHVVGVVGEIPQAGGRSTGPANAPVRHTGACERLSRGGKEAASRPTEPPNPHHVHAAKARLRRLIPFLAGNVLEEVKKAFKELVEWSVEHYWGEEVELVGPRTPRHDPPQLLRLGGGGG